MSSENIATSNNTTQDKKKRTRRTRRGGIRGSERRRQMRISIAANRLQKFLNDKNNVFKSEPTSTSKYYIPSGLLDDEEEPHSHYYLPSGLLDDEEEPHYYLPTGLLDDEEEPHYYLPTGLLDDAVCFPVHGLACRLNPNARAYYPLRPNAPEYIPSY